ncbi:MAG: substrate-binding domain-containing protein, partial [Propionivibrio sp.]
MTSPPQIANRRSTSPTRRWLLGVLAVLLASLAPVSGAAELKRIGVTVTDLGNPFFVRIARGVENAARKIAGPGVRVDVLSSAYDLDRQIEQIDSFIQRKVDLIMLIAADSLAIEPAVRHAQAAGIYVIALDVRAAGADATFTTDNVQAGELACQYIADRLHR